MVEVTEVEVVEVEVLEVDVDVVLVDATDVVDVVRTTELKFAVITALEITVSTAPCVAAEESVEGGVMVHDRNL